MPLCPSSAQTSFGYDPQEEPTEKKLTKCQKCGEVYTTSDLSILVSVRGTLLLCCWCYDDICEEEEIDLQ